MRVNERFKDAFWAGISRSIIVGGAGGIGSWLVPLLSRTGQHNIYLYDMDTVDDVNLGGQLFKVSDTGKKKTTAVKNLTSEVCAYPNISTYDRYEASSMYTPIMFSCFDNMASRKIMFNNWKKDWRDPGCQLEEMDKLWRYLFIDGRINYEI